MGERERERGGEEGEKGYTDVQCHVQSYKRLNVTYQT